VAQYADMNPTGYQSNLWKDGKGFGAWPRPAIYQYSSTGRISGYGGNLDINLSYIDKVAWERLANPSGGTTAGKNLETLAGEVQKGIWGNGADRQKGLGNLFNAVQAIINHRANGDVGTAVKVLAEEVKAGRL